MKKIITGVGFLGLFVSQAIVSSAAYFNSAPIAQCETQITRSLQVGSENNDVYVLQQMLSRSSYLNAQPNGHFGYQTASAVRAFQRDNNLPITGTVGSMTRESLNERLCDTDLIGNNGSPYNYNDYTVGSTYVGATDPFVQVITPMNTSPVVYSTPQNLNTPVLTPSYNTIPISSSQVINSTSGYIPSPFGYINTRPNYIAEPSGSVTVTSPVVNSIYREGDTVVMNWSSNNIQSNSYVLSLENSSTGQSKAVALISGSSYSFVLTRELLDAVCMGSCSSDQQGSFKIVMTTPTTDSYGDVHPFRVSIAPITIKRPSTTFGKVTLSTSKTPVDSGEAFKLYVNFPSTSWDATLAANYTVKVKALCTSSVVATVSGVACGQEYVVPSIKASQFQQEVSALIINPMNYKQDITFQVLIVNVLGQIVGLSETKVTVNSAPLGW